MLSSSVHDQIQRRRTKQRPQEHRQIKTQAVYLRQMKMLQANHDGLQEATSSCMDTSDSRMKDHGFASIRRYVRKSSSMTLNEALCGRQPDLLFYIYINMTVYIALFNRNIK